MSPQNFINHFHIGKVIKEVARQKGISTKKIAAVMNHDPNNADKIFLHDDMDTDDIIRISYLLEYNILFWLVLKYLPHLSFTNNDIDTDTCLLKIDMKNKRVSCKESNKDCSFIKQIHIGEQIKKMAYAKNWCGTKVAKQLQCTPATVSYLYQSKSLKIKKLLQISEVFQYDFISHIYLPEMVIPNSLKFLENCTILVNRQNIRILNPDDNSCLLFFLSNECKKREA